MHLFVLKILYLNMYAQYITFTQIVFGIEEKYDTSHNSLK